MKAATWPGGLLAPGTCLFVELPSPQRHLSLGSQGICLHPPCSTALFPSDNKLSIDAHSSCGELMPSLCLGRKHATQSLGCTAFSSHCCLALGSSPEPLPQAPVQCPQHTQAAVPGWEQLHVLHLCVGSPPSMHRPREGTTTVSQAPIGARGPLYKACKVTQFPGVQLILTLEQEGTDDSGRTIVGTGCCPSHLPLLLQVLSQELRA